MRSGPKILTELSPLTPERLHHVVANVLRKIPIHARDALGKLLIHFRDQFGLRARAFGTQPAMPTFGGFRQGPLALRFERNEELDVVEAGWIGAVVGPASLCHDHFDFLELLHHGTRLIGLGRGGLERDVDRQRGSNPEIALLQFRHELAPQKRQHGDRQRDQAAHDSQGDAAIFETQRQLTEIPPLEDPNKQVVRHRLEMLEAEQAQHRCHGQCQNQCAGQGKRVGIGHRSKDLTFGTLHGE